MIRLGLRLTLHGGREAAVRLAITAAAVALGVGMLLVTLAGINALSAQNARAAWLGTGAGASANARDPLWWVLNVEQFGDQTIERVDVAATGPSSPVPPGLPHLPGPGQFYASPALSQLLHATPADELGDRFPRHQSGTIGSSALPSPDTLVIVIGHTARQLSHAPGARQVTSIRAKPGVGNQAAGYDSSTLQALLAIGALALLFPVLVFIGTATRLSAARREQRFAAMRLAGATPRQVSLISAVEASVAALAGVATGLVLFFLLRPALQHVSFTGQPFAPGDLSLGLGDILAVAIGVPAAAAAAAHVALRRVQISPLGVSRRATPPAPRAYRAVPLLAGIGELAYFVGIGPPKSSSGQIEAYLLGFFLVMAGLILVGPWLTMVGSRVMARRTSRPAVLIAGRRLSDNPRAAFRAIAGLTLALFVTSVAAGITTTIIADHGAAGSGASDRSTLADQFVIGQTASGHALTAVASVPGAVLSGLRSIQGVQGVAVIHTDPQAITFAKEDQASLPGLVSCAQLSHVPALGRCPAGAAVASVTVNLDNAATSKSQSATVWPAAAVSVRRLQRIAVQTLIVGTDGTAPAREQTITALDVAFPYLGPPATLSEIAGADSYAELRHVTDVVILASLIIAGCSLAVSVTAGLGDRKRPFSLLRLTGAPLGMLRGVVALESAVPLIVIAVVSAGMGLLASELFLRSELSESLRPLGADYYVIVLAGLAASLGVIASTFPLLARITGPETARNE